MTEGIFMSEKSTTKFMQFIVNVNNASAGGKVQVQLAPSGSSKAAWSTGETFSASDSGMQLTSTSGTLPLTQFNVSGSYLTFVTSSTGGGGGALAYTISLYVSGSADCGSFTLTAYTDPNTVVTANFAGKTPQVVNNDTPFIWP